MSQFFVFIGRNKSMSYDEPLTTAGMKSLYRQRLNQALMLLFKCLKGMEPSYFGNLFKYRHTPYGLRGEACLWNCLILTLKLKRHFFFSYLFTKLWNNLPSQVRLSRDVNNFKSKLQDCGSLERVLWSSGHVFSYLTTMF